ncbi:MAG: sigma-70 family RNA polymerase sigma factor [Ignavibacteriaceae bacterium]|nr:sigma-70 family RNA polymerase sigma factor [Ignavibacteriaceae bacterium]
MPITQTVFTLDDDFSLINAFNDGDQSAFSRLVSRHKEKVRNLIYATLGDARNVEDISQEVFIIVYHKLHTFRFQSRFTTWLYRITINKCKDHLRRVKLRSIFTYLHSEDAEKVTVSSSESFDIKQVVREAVNRLPEKLRYPLILRDFEGCSYEEIADVLETEIGTVKSRIFRAREFLKKDLEPLKNELL